MYTLIFLTYMFFGYCLLPWGLGETKKYRDKRYEYNNNDRDRRSELISHLQHNAHSADTKSER